MRSGGRRPASAASGGARPAGGWALRLLRNALLWLVPVWALWALAAPAYNRLLLASGEALLHLVESPDVTDLLPRRGGHEAYVARRDFPPARTLVRAFRVTDLHFHLVLLGALFLAVPGVPWRRRLRNLGWAALATAVFDLLLLVVFVESVYATGLGDWSRAHAGPFARNAWGLAEHLLDLPLKLALPFTLWAAFYVRLLFERRDPS
ncbi:MAG TPA: hypothetical protein VF121_18965 [Thermoanaerobaculia bacterium]|nr:hypothetical protein [Thermoanaerobaculia bacterium]